MNTPNESEYAVLSLLLAYPNETIPAMRKVGVGSEHFSSSNGKIVAGAALHLYDKGLAVDPTSIKSLLSVRQPRFFSANSGEEFLSSLLDLINSGRVKTPNVEQYIASVKDEDLRRALLHNIRDFAQGAESATSATEYLSEMQTKLFNISKQRIRSNFVSMTDMLTDHFGKIEEAINNPKDVAGLRTPIGSLNCMTGGIMPGEYWLVGGYPGLGKTSFLLDTALVNALVDDKVVFFCSAEMPAAQVLQKILARQFRIPTMTLRTGKVSSREKEYENGQIKKMMEAVKTKSPNGGMDKTENFRFIECAGMTVPQLEGAILAEAANIGREPDLIVVDYIQILQPHTGDNQSEKMFWTSEALKTMSVRRGWSILVASQLNDDGEVFGGRAPHHNAHVHFDIVEDGKDMWFKVSKVRMGPTANLKVRFLKQYGIFEDVGGVTVAKQE